MNLNDFANEVHQNAVEHGWWETDRPDAEVMALIHSEWSEALEEYRDNRPMVWYDSRNKGDDCGGGGCCGADIFECVCKGHPHLGGCPRGHKPEGIAVELIDGCIRILDYIGKTGTKIHEIVTLKKLMRAVPDELLECNLPTLVARLHWYTSKAYIWGGTPITERIAQEQMSYLYEALAMACAWIQKQGLNPEDLLREKHAYNKTRPFKHGGKKC